MSTKLDIHSLIDGSDLLGAGGLTAALSDLLAQQSFDGISTVRQFRDGFSAINRQVKAGELKVIGSKPEDQTVLLSIGQLAEFLREASEQMTLGASLARSGFNPVADSLDFIDVPEATDNFDLYELGDDETGQAALS